MRPKTSLPLNWRLNDSRSQTLEPLSHAVSQKIRNVVEIALLPVFFSPKFG